MSENSLNLKRYIQAFMLSAFFIISYFVSGASFIGDPASSIELKNNFLFKTGLENISYAIVFRGDAPIYPLLLSLHHFLGLGDITFALWLNASLLLLSQIILFETVYKITNSLLVAFWSIIIILNNFVILDYYTSPISLVLHYLFLVVFFKFNLVKITEERTSVNNAGWGILASVAMMNNYAFVVMIIISSLNLLKKAKLKDCICFSLATLIFPVLFLLSNISGVNGKLLGGYLRDFPLHATLGSIARSFLPYETNGYFVFFVLLLLGLLTFRKIKKVSHERDLYIYIGFFLLASFCVYYFFDYQALINKKRSINIGLPLVLLGSITLNSFKNYKIRIITASILVLYAIGANFQYLIKRYKNGPKYHTHEMRNSKIIQKLKNHRGIEDLLMTNNPVVSYMYLRKRVVRGPVSTNDLEKIKSNKIKFFLEFKDAPRKYLRPNKMANYQRLKLIDKENAFKLYRLYQD